MDASISPAGSTIAPANGPPPSRLAPGLAALIVFAVPALAYTNLLLYHLYARGSFLLDTGWLAFVISRGGLALANPEPLGGSFFSIHISPLFILTSLIRPVLPISDSQFFAGFLGTSHALLGMGVFWVLYSGFGLRRGPRLMGACVISILFSFNGLALAIVRYPHPEILIASSLILFFVALHHRRLLLAALCAAIALATREDAGFHLFALLFILVAVNRWYGISLQSQRAEIFFALAAFICSATAIGVPLALGRSPDTFRRIYLGDDPLGRLSVGMLGPRLIGLLAYRTYLVLPGLIAAIWAVRSRNPYILIGYVAFIPWTLLQLVANSDMTASLSVYYPYPLLIAGFWPLLGTLYANPTGVRAAATVPLLYFVVMIAGSFVALSAQANPGGFSLPADFFHPPAFAREAATERLIAELRQTRNSLGTVLVDDSMLGVAPNDFRKPETLMSPAATAPNTVLFFRRGYRADEVRAIAAAAGLSHRYAAIGTSICLSTDRAIPATTSLGTLLMPADPPC